MANFGILAKIGVDASQMTQGLDKAGKQVDGFGSRLGQSIKAGALVAAAAIGAMAVKGVSSFMDFEKKMAEVFTLMPDMTAEAEAKMTEDMMNLSTTMGVDLIDATNALYQAISAGVPRENVMTFLETAAKASIAGVSDLETSVAALTTIMNGYGMEAGSAEKISDVLFSTVKIGVTNFTELGQNIGKVTPLAAALGISIEEVGAMFAVLTKTLGAGKTAEAGTQIRSMLAELSKAGMKAFENFIEASGKTFPAFIKSGGTVTEALKLLGDHSKKTGKGMVDMFRGVEAGMGALTLAADESKILGSALKEITKDTGSMNLAWVRMENTASAQWDKMKANWEKLLVTMGAALMPTINKIVETLKDAFATLAGVVRTVAEFFEEHPAIYKAVAGTLKTVVAAVIGYKTAALLAAAAAGTKAVALRVAAAAMALFGRNAKVAGTAMKFSGLGLVIGAVTALVTVFSLFGDAAEEAAEKSRIANEKILADLKEQRAATMRERKAAEANIDAMRKQQALAAKGKEIRGEDVGRSELENLLLIAKEKQKQIGVEQREERYARVRTQKAFTERKEHHGWFVKNRGKAHVDTVKQMQELDLLRTALIKHTEKQTALEIDYAAQVKKVADLEKEVTKEVLSRLNSIKEAKQILVDTMRVHQLSATEMGKALLINERLGVIDRERAKILKMFEGDRRLDAESRQKLKDLTAEKLKLEKQSFDIAKKKRDELLKEEITIHQDAIVELEKKLRLQEGIRDAAKGAADAAERELAAQQKKAGEAAKELKALGKQFGGEKFDFRTGQRIGVGAMKLSSSKLRREFRDLQAQGQLPEGVKTLRDFRKHVEDQIRAAQQKAAIEKNKAKALADEAKKQRQLELDAANKIKDINTKIHNEKTAMIVAQEKLMAKEKKHLADIVTERQKWDKLMGQMRAFLPGADPGRNAPNVDDLLKAWDFKAGGAIGGMVQQLQAGGFDDTATVDELEDANESLSDIREWLARFQVVNR